MYPKPTGSDSVAKYRVEYFLAEGGMGSIYVGKKLGAGGFARPVVMKQLLKQFEDDDKHLAMLLREARLTAALDHVNIVGTIDLVSSDQGTFMVMEYIPGADLATLIQKAKSRRTVIPWQCLLFIAKEALSGLSYAHKKSFDASSTTSERSFVGTIHSDMTPSNILISQAGEVKITDFGIAESGGVDLSSFRIKGKVGYMSPEQAMNQPIDGRSDIFSLAVCLYEGLTGEKLFVAPNILTAPQAIFSQPIPSLEKKLLDLPQGLDAIMQKALSLDKNNRYASAKGFQNAILTYCTIHGVMMSSLDLRVELERVCGPSDAWRQQDTATEFERNDGTVVLDTTGAQEAEDSVPQELERSDLTSVLHLSEGSGVLSDRKVAEHNRLELTGKSMPSQQRRVVVSQLPFWLLVVILVLFVTAVLVMILTTK